MTKYFLTYQLGVDEKIDPLILFETDFEPYYEHDIVRGTYKPTDIKYKCLWTHDNGYTKRGDIVHGEPALSNKNNRRFAGLNLFEVELTETEMALFLIDPKTFMLPERYKR